MMFGPIGSLAQQNPIISKTLQNCTDNSNEKFDFSIVDV